MPSNRPLRIFFSVGEPSGDVHAANLIAALGRRVELDAFGYGGPRMAEAGCRLHEDLTALAVMWFGRAILNFPKFRALVHQADDLFHRQPPDAVVLVDYPGFNWWIARKAKARGIPVFYHLPPQIWAWASWRVRKMRRLVDHVLCALPFEEPWFRRHGCNATYIGHPFFDEVRHHRYDDEFIRHLQRGGGRLVGILPGSRAQEVASNFRWFVQAARRVRASVPDARFAVAAFKPDQAEACRRMLAGSDLPVEVHCGKTPEVMRAAECCMSVSGSVSLELLHHAKPTVILYWINPVAYFAQSFFRRVKYITLVNLLAADELYPADTTPYDPSQDDADQVLFPEYLTYQDRSEHIAAHLVEWLTRPARRAALVERLQRLCKAVGQPGATQRAAEYLAETLAGRQPALQPPHFAAECPAPGDAAPKRASGVPAARGPLQ